MKEKKKESWFSGGEGAAAPHTIPVPLGLSPAAGAWGQRTDRVSGGRDGSPGTGRGPRPSCGSLCPHARSGTRPSSSPTPTAPTKEDESGLTLLLSLRSVDKVYVHVCVWACKCAHQPVCKGRGGSQSLTYLHLSPRPAARSPRPPSGGWRTRTAVPEEGGGGWQDGRPFTPWTS